MEEFAEFLANQAAKVAELAVLNPCGYLTCSKKAIIKRDIDFQYSLQSSTPQRKEVNPHFEGR